MDYGAAKDLHEMVSGRMILWKKACGLTWPHRMNTKIVVRNKVVTDLVTDLSDGVCISVR